MRDSDYRIKPREYYFENDILKDKTLGGELERWAEKYNENIAFVYEDEQVSYKEFNENVDRLVEGFLRLGLKKNQHVIVQLANNDKYIYTLFALEKIGVLPVLTLPAHRENDLNGIFETVQPVAYIVESEYMGFSYQSIADTMRNKFDSIKYIIANGILDNSINIESLFVSDTDRMDYERPEGREIAHILLSGGTTGTPKLIARTHADYLYSAEMSAQRSQVAEEDIFLCALPVSHNFAMNSFGIVGTFICGATLLICPHPAPEEILELLDVYSATALALVPSLASLCADILSSENDYDISSLRTVLIGGAYLESHLAAKVLKSFGCVLQQVFGTAEGFTCTTYINDDYSTVINTQGKPISEHDEMRIVDSDLNDVEEGESGEFIVRSPYTIEKYYLASDSVNSQCFTKSGFYRTGDKAKIDKNGNIVLEGRVKEQINVSGEKIMPSEIEENLCKLSYINEAAVVGVKVDEFTTQIIAFLITDNRELELNTIRTELRNIGMAEYKLPNKIIIIDNFPLTKIGKTDKNELIEIARSLNG